jgi:hypothetical protein
MGLSGVAIVTYYPQYRPLSAIRYLDVNPLPTRYTLFITLPVTFQSNQASTLDQTIQHIKSLQQQIQVQIKI